MKDLARYMLLCCCLTISTNSIFGSTIKPFGDLGELVDASDGIYVVDYIGVDTVVFGDLVRYEDRFSVESCIKGNCSDIVVTPKRSRHLGDSYIKVSGDIDYSVGGRYLLFLREIKDGSQLVPACGSYYVYRLEEHESIPYAIPFYSSGSLDLLVEHKYRESAHQVFQAKELILLIEKRIKSLQNWDDTHAVASRDVIEHFIRKIPVRKSLPGQCILLRGSSSNPPRWPLNEVTPIRLHYQLDGPVCSDITNELNSTIDHMKDNYPGLQLDYPSVLSNYSAQCSPGLEDQFSNLSSYFTSNFGDPGRTMIIFNDICDDMPPLFGNCGGVYGFAAATASGTHSFNGQSYTSLQAGFVSVNEGVPQCLCNSTDRGNSATNFVLFLAHELGHTLGLNHIVSGTANLNPNCCVDISSLDQGCINTLYPTHLNCTGHDINFANQTIPSGISLARNILRSQSNVDIANGSSVSWRAQSSIDIDGDFTVPTGSTLEVDIDNCN